MNLFYCILSKIKVVVVDNQMQPIIYQQQPNEPQTQYIFQDNDNKNEQTYTIVNQQQPQQVYFTAEMADGTTQLVQHQGQTIAVQSPHMQSTIEQQQQQQQAQQAQLNASQSVVIQQYQPQQQLLVANANNTPQAASLQAQGQQIIIQNVPQQPAAPQQPQPNQMQNVVMRSPQFQGNAFVYDSSQVMQQPQQLIAVEPMQTVRLQSPTQQIQSQTIQTQQQVSSPMQTQQIQPQSIQTTPQTKSSVQLLRKHVPNQVRQKILARTTQPMKIVQPTMAQINQPIRYQLPNQVRAQNQSRIVTTFVRTPRAPATLTYRGARVIGPTRPAQGTSPMIRSPRIVGRFSSPSQVKIATTGINMQNSTKTYAILRTPATNTMTKAVTQNQQAMVNTNVTGSEPVAVDLEESITAAKITKPANSPLPPQQQQQQQQVQQQQFQLRIVSGDEHKMIPLNNGKLMTLAEYKRQQQKIQSQLQQQQQTQLQQQATQAQLQLIRGMNSNRPRPRLSQPIAVPRQPVRRVVAQSPVMPPPEVDQQQQQAARMLVILQSGEQRLITFTLPKESCTVQEILEQVNVPFTQDTPIQCVPDPGNDIDYLVTVGYPVTESPSEIITAAQSSLQSKMVQQQQQQQQFQNVQQTNQQSQMIQTESPSTTVPTQSAQPKPDPRERFVAGMLALCNACGFSSQDHVQCQRCNRIFATDPKKIPMSTPSNVTRAKPPTVAITLTEKQRKELEITQRKHQIAMEK